MQSRILFETLVCGGEVPTGVKLNRYAGRGSRCPWHCDDEPLFGRQCEPKVIVSMSLGDSLLFKLRCRSPEKTQSENFVRSW